METVGLKTLDVLFFIELSTRQVRRAGVTGERLDWLLIVGRQHLEQVLRVYVEHYDHHRPHRALGLEPPDSSVSLGVVGEGQRSGVHRRDLLGGLLHEYRRAA